MYIHSLYIGLWHSLDVYKPSLSDIIPKKVGVVASFKPE